MIHKKVYPFATLLEALGRDQLSYIQAGCHPPISLDSDDEGGELREYRDVKGVPFARITNPDATIQEILIALQLLDGHCELLNAETRISALTHTVEVHGALERENYVPYLAKLLQRQALFGMLDLAVSRNHVMVLAHGVSAHPVWHRGAYALYLYHDTNESALQNLWLNAEELRKALQMTPSSYYDCTSCVAGLSPWNVLIQICRAPHKCLFGDVGHGHLREELASDLNRTVLGALKDPITEQLLFASLWYRANAKSTLRHWKTLHANPSADLAMEVQAHSVAAAFDKCAGFFENLVLTLITEEFDPGQQHGHLYVSRDLQIYVGEAPKPPEGPAGE